MENKETVEQENTMQIGDQEIKESEMTDQQKYFARQIQDLRAKKDKINFEADQVMAALNVFQAELIKTVQETAKEVLEDDTEES
jgi:cell division protein ZapA (FtsZ GTPase activity inhibitor)|tara:strand:+ start:827 stop:1078 length:252 start_codon:yes stop_codon:yes gene_type:complete